MAGITWTGQVNFTDSSDVATTGVATLTLTPDGGISNLPALAAGTPGLPPTFRNITVNQVSAGTTPPPATWTLVDAGGPGLASVYDLTLYVNAGATGASGAFALSDATDLTGTLTDKCTVRYSTSDSKWHAVTALSPSLYAASYFNAYSGNAASATIATVTVPSQQYDWYPDVAGYATVNGTDNTSIDLVCRLNNSVSGNIVGFAPGTPAAAFNAMTLVRSFNTPLGSGYGKVLAGNAATFYFLAKQTASTTDSWTVNSSPAAFSVAVLPIP